MLHTQAHLEEINQSFDLAQKFYDILEFSRQKYILNMTVNFIVTRTVEQKQVNEKRQYKST